MNLPLLYDLPFWVSGLAFIGLLLTSLEIGYRIGLKRQPATASTDKARGGDVVLTGMLGLLGLVLAFTYAFTIARADHRKEAVIVEANALGTAFLRAGLLDAPYGEQLQDRLCAYARTRVIEPGTGNSSAKRGAFIEHTLAAQSGLWPIVEEAVKKGEAGPLEATVVTAMNDVIDAHAMRLYFFFDVLPAPVLRMVLFVGCMTLAVAGFSAGIAGRRMNRWRMTSLALVLAAVMLVVTDFDRPMNGFVRVSQSSLEIVVSEMCNALDARHEGEVPATDLQTP